MCCVHPQKDYKPEKQKKLIDMFNNAALRENTFLKYLLPYMIINTSVMIVPIMWVRNVSILMLVTLLICHQQLFPIRWYRFYHCLYFYPLLSDSVNKCYNSIWYDFDRKRLHVDVWFRWWSSCPSNIWIFISSFQYHHTSKESKASTVKTPENHLIDSRLKPCSGLCCKYLFQSCWHWTQAFRFLYWQHF